MDAASHSAISPGNNRLVGRIKRKGAKVTEFRAVVKMPRLGVIKPDASLLVSRGAPVREDVNILVPIEIEVHGTKPILAARWSFHAEPFAALQVLHRHSGLCRIDLDIANDGCRVAKLIVRLHVGNDPERELWQIGRDVDDEAPAVREILGDRFVCPGRTRGYRFLSPGSG